MADRVASWLTSMFSHTTNATSTGEAELFELWARSADEPEPSLRDTYRHREDAEDEAARLARASGADGVMSVWVEGSDSGVVVWCAGEKAKVREMENAPPVHKEPEEDLYRELPNNGNG